MEYNAIKYVIGYQIETTLLQTGCLKLVIIIIIIIKSLFNEDSLLKTYQIQTYSACNIETSLYTTWSSTKQ